MIPRALLKVLMVVWVRGLLLNLIVLFWSKPGQSVLYKFPAFYKAYHSVFFYHIGISIQTCRLLMDELSTYDMFAISKKEPLC